MIPEEIESAWANSLYRVNDFLFEVDKKKEQKHYCRCIRKKSDGCSARIIVVKGADAEIIRTSGTLNHEEERRDRIRRAAKTEMKRTLLLRPDKSCKQVYQEVLVRSIANLRQDHAAEEIGAALPNFEEVRSSLHRQRAKVRPVLPLSRSDIVLRDTWTRTLDGEDFLVFDDGTTDRILGFSTEEAMTILCRADAIYMDGTFKVVPHLFAQLYTLHAQYRGQMMPLVYFLLPDKQKETYIRMFTLLKTFAVTRHMVFQPPKMQLDFEVSSLKAIEESLPGTEVKGCNFHFSQAIWRKTQQVGLRTFYDNDPSIRSFVKGVMALSLVPEHLIDDAWLELQSESPTIDHAAYAKLDELKENFGPRTTNNIEAWHSALNRMVKESHVNIFVLIGHLKQDQSKHKSDRLLLDVGHPPKPLAEKYITPKYKDWSASYDNMKTMKSLS
ncbi:uncharacterized protein LOC114828143 [Galendromus occidentalis]|uniref:Uncharacterized protein LOC114828143 n=1 Tax=Galendromus occidentalis TaxID=34638 RepID=A0AAJ7SDT9_9ACAR|nr:uncharacterized protein LOC114828143 [Galendromus occidentalis]